MTGKLQLRKFECLRRWRHDNFTLYMYNMGWNMKQEKWQIGYKFFWDKGLLFEGEDFYCPELDGKRPMLGLLGFITLKPGDTDSDWFDKYTDFQRRWTESNDIDDLQLWVYDQENRK
jgi:hypothetical protein